MVGMCTFPLTDLDGERRVRPNLRVRPQLVGASLESAWTGVAAQQEKKEEKY